MSARSSTVGPSPFRSTPTTPVPPTPSCTSKPAVRSRSATRAAVRVSWCDSSGCWCTSRYSSSCQDREDSSPARTDATAESDVMPEVCPPVPWYNRPMTTEAGVLLALDLTGTFAFALNGALTALRVARLDIVGVVALGMITALGGGIIRDVILDSLPPATFVDWRYLAVAAAGGLIAFVFGRHLDRLTTPMTVLDAAGLSLFAVTGAGKALALGLGPAQAVILGAITGVGGGTLRDVLVRQVPTVLSSGLYAIPALVGATATVVISELGVYGPLAAVGAAALCFGIRMTGVRFDL